MTLTAIEKRAGLKNEILHYLPHGKANAITGKRLAAIMGEKDTRHIRLAILELLEEHNPVASTPSPPYGYYLAETPEELLECMAVLKGYCVNAALHRRALKRCLSKLYGQRKLI